jgi:hypothetical protein
VAAMIVLVNFSVIIVFIKRKSIRENRHHNLVLCLSISDLVIGLSLQITFLRMLIPAWTHVLLPCMTPIVLVFVGTFMSLFQTFLVSLHRFLVAVNSPWNDRLFQGHRKYLIYVISWSSALTWMFALASPTPKSDWSYCNVIDIYGDHYPIFARVSLILSIREHMLYFF